MVPVPISIIIPTFNEEAGIADSMKGLLNLVREAQDIEIIVSDASSDRTPEILASFPVRVCRSAKGRAVQMNTGARHAKGSILYFLHADTLPPATFPDDIRRAASEGRRAGCFRMRFDDENPLMSLFGWFTQFPLPVCRGGDQSLFIERSLFEKICGFDEVMQIMEDYDMVRRIEAHTPVHILETEVTTSARKFQQNGIIPLQINFAAIHLMHAFGADQESLKRYYRENIR
ncbi:glycosyltransferase family 2 protein [Chlorobium sp. BLA1]|uniref:TIGR04283 family arsenosugar biosynthesis glycosyltransferase n=1 Tax=Candidatus Chlorobium masyuteum TaxID=2716876 RepID=UPI00141D98B3|nr:TIGR04283 family arsenosugar biosynthesis glycosyltransferase [Candidatus Chlorobium masyuteum]NHQ60719.1 glycosyltransferase family 2 protein [Candidatus Chlorobium masyuteum]